MLQCLVDHHSQLLPMGWLRLIAQPFIVAFTMGIGVLDNGQSIFNADGVAQVPNSLCTAPEVSEFPVTVQIDRTPNNVIMHMGPVNMSANKKGVFALGEPFGKFHAQPVGFFRRDFARTEGLTDMVSNHIVFSTNPSGGSNILTLGYNKLCVCNPAITLISSNESAIVCLMWVCYIVDDVTDSSTLSAAFSNMQRHNTRGCHEVSLLSKAGRPWPPILYQYKMIWDFFTLCIAGGMATSL